MSHTTTSAIGRAFEQGEGILRLAPTWVPRVFCVPGRRIKLHPDDYYALGTARGGIDERWLSSTTHADNGPGTPPDEGLSHVVLEDGREEHRIVLRDAIEELKGSLIGKRLWDAHGGWPVYSKFFDNQGPLPHHIHHRDQHARRVGALGKPEAYYFPPQLNNHGGDFPHTFFGLNPDVTREEVLDALRQFTKGDNKITALSRSYRLEVGTGWDVPPGLLHAPGSLCTYEPQRASDVFAQYQSVVNGQVLQESGLWKDMPPEAVGNYEYLLEVIDWDINVDADFHRHRFMRPVPVRGVEQMTEEGYCEKWICYKSTAFSAKELTVFPGSSVALKDGGAFGLIVVQGHGTMGVWDVESPALIRFGQPTFDEFFVSEAAATEGVRIRNPSRSDPLVMLKHFGPGHPDLPAGRHP
ncbi:MAG: hypothetical protein NTU62_12785 [Spirochaetes bacterium]|nr:hypothetical protein [Spirochaetota bacterium]